MASVRYGDREGSHVTSLNNQQSTPNLFHKMTLYKICSGYTATYIVFPPRKRLSSDIKLDSRLSDLIEIVVYIFKV